MGDVGTGTQITLAGASWLAEVTGIESVGMEKAEYNATHLGSAVVTSNPAKLDKPKDLSIAGLFNPGQLPATGASGAVQITWPDGSKWGNTGWLKDFEAGAVVEERMEYAAVVVLTDVWTYTAPT